MSINGAIAHLGVDHVQEILNRGRAYDTMSVDSFDGRQLGAWAANACETQAAYGVLAAAGEMTVRIAARAAAQDRVA